MADEKKPVEGAKAPKKKMAGATKGIITACVVAVVAAAGFGFWQWHETPQFCAAICHNMDQYLETYLQEEGVTGVDKYGNAVSDTTAMLSTRHRETMTTAKPEIRCMGCHHPVMAEQVSEAMSHISGNYYDPLTERVGEDLTHWEGTQGTQFCVNEACHAYLRGSDGLVDRSKLEDATVRLEFNPHSQHHDIELQCTECHKGHRASVLVCTGCHEHDNVALPSGWVTYDQGEQIIAQAYGGNNMLAAKAS